MNTPGNDVEQGSPQEIVSALYEVISGPADEIRDWDRFRSMFIESARIILASSRPDSEVGLNSWSVEEFIEEADRFYREDGFWEREVSSRMEQFGKITHIFSTYESFRGTKGGAPVARGINSIQLLYDSGRWSIANILFDHESQLNPIPERYLSDTE
jgi:hypothetical protein